MSAAKDDSNKPVDVKDAKAAPESVTAKQIVTPWKVQADGKKAFNYQKLTEDFGLEEVDSKMLERFERVTKTKLHPWLTRAIFYAHKGMGEMLDAVEAGRPVYLYTGRGPSNDMHIGHTLSFLFTKYLDGNVKTKQLVPKGYRMMNPKLSQPGYGDDWNRFIVKNTGDKLKEKQLKG